MNKKLSYSSLFFIVTILFCFAVTVGAQVKVRGYFRKDGTYVKPHFRSNPDGNPYNNYSFPGNYNPNTGKISPGNPETYLNNYYNKKSPTLYLPETSHPTDSSSPYKDETTKPSNYLPKPSKNSNSYVPKKPIKKLDSGTFKYAPKTKNTDYIDGSKMQWVKWIKDDFGINVDYKNYTSSQLSELHSKLSWAKWLKSDFGINVDSSKYTSYELSDLHSRIQWTKWIKNDFGVTLDYEKYKSFQLADIHSRMQWAKWIKRKFGRVYDYNKYSSYEFSQIYSSFEK